MLDAYDIHSQFLSKVQAGWDVTKTVFNCWQTSVPKNWR